MRVIGGAIRGRRVKVPRGQSVRPTAARVKEAIFNILAHDLSGFRVLDLFAGAGGLSIEALSRGASEAILVDVSRHAARTIRENLEALGLSDRASVWTGPVPQALRRLARKGESFDLIFLDPPYERGWIDKVLTVIARGNLLRQAGILVAEHSVREKVEARYGSLHLQDQRRYGSTAVSFFGLSDVNDLQ